MASTPIPTSSYFKASSTPIGASTHLTQAQIASALATGAKLGLLTAAPMLAAAPTLHDPPKPMPAVFSLQIPALPPDHRQHHAHALTSAPPLQAGSEVTAAP